MSEMKDQSTAFMEFMTCPIGGESHNHRSEPMIRSASSWENRFRKQKRNTKISRRDIVSRRSTLVPTRII
jgi:hypothetical protein